MEWQHQTRRTHQIQHIFIVSLRIRTQSNKTHEAPMWYECISITTSPMSSKADAKQRSSKTGNKQIQQLYEHHSHKTRFSVVLIAHTNTTARAPREMADLANSKRICVHRVAVEVRLFGWCGEGWWGWQSLHRNSLSDNLNVGIVRNCRWVIRARAQLNNDNGLLTWQYENGERQIAGTPQSTISHRSR